MLGLANANALTVVGLTAFVAAELQFAGFNDDEAGVRETAAQCLGPLLKATLIALDLSGLTKQEQSAGVRDVLADYLGTGAMAAVAAAPGPVIDARPS